jgi:hypothetical protein
MIFELRDYNYIHKFDILILLDINIDWLLI